MNEPNVPLQKFKIRCYLNKKMVKYDLFLEAKYNFDTNCVALSVQKIPILVGFTWSDVDFVCKVTLFKLRH